MIDTEVIYVVLAMAIVTYIPRMLPMVLLRDAALPPYVMRFMRFIPYAALGALIFPGILTAAGDGEMVAAIVGAAVSLVLAYMELNVVLVIAGGIAGTFVVILLSGG